MNVRMRMQGLAQPGGAILGAGVLRMRVAAPVLCGRAAQSVPLARAAQLCGPGAGHAVYH